MRTTPADETVLPLGQAWRALAALCLGFFMSLMDQTVFAVATPEIMKAFDARLDEVVWVTSMFLLFFVVPLLVTGRLGDRFGQRTLFQVGVGLFTLSALAAMFAPTLQWLIVARAFQGMGAAILAPQTMSVINRVFPREHRGAALGAWGAVGSMATLVGPVVGGFLVGTFGWQGAFMLHLPIGVLAILLAGAWVPRLPTFARGLDLLSVLVSLVAMGSLVVAVQQGPVYGWPVWSWILLAVGAAGLVLFIRMQATAGRRGVEALVPLQLFRNRNYSLGAFSVATLGFSAASMMLPVMLWLQDGRGFTSQQAGLMLVPMAVIAGVGSPLVGRAADRVHPRILSVAGFTAMIAGVLAINQIMLLDAPSFWFLPAAGLLGVGNAMVWAPNSATAMRSVDIAYMGAASGVYNTTRQTGAVIGAAAVGAAMQVGSASLGLVPGLAASLLLPVAVLVPGLIAVAFFRADHVRPG